MTDPEGSQPEVPAVQRQGRRTKRKQPESTGSHKLGQKLGQDRLQIHERRIPTTGPSRVRSPEGHASCPVQLRLGPHKLSSVSHAQDHGGPVADRPLTLGELAELQHVEPVEIDELVSDIWESDEELDAFLADLRTSRNASVA